MHTHPCHSEHTFHGREEQVEKPDSNQPVHCGSQPGPEANKSKNTSLERWNEENNAPLNYI